MTYLERLMGSDSKASRRIPVIDFSNLDLKPGTSAWELVKSQVQTAVQEYGCFEALFNKVPRELRTAINRVMNNLFGLPLETKRRTISEKPFHGYIGSSPVLPLYESICIEGPDSYKKVERQSNVYWTEGNIDFSKTLHSFAKQVSELDQIVRRMIVESFHIEKYLDNHINSTHYNLRVIKYKEANTTDEKLVGLKAHADQNIVSILYQNEVDGLEIRIKDGEWINAKFSPDSFIVLMGESFNAWTNGRLHCPYHRVMMSGNKARYSAALFSVPNEGYIIKAPEELVDEEHPLQYKPYEYMEYLKLRYAEIGKTTESPLKAYYGT